MRMKSATKVSGKTQILVLKPPLKRQLRLGMGKEFTMTTIQGFQRRAKKKKPMSS